MASGGRADLFQSRRTHFERCLLWKADLNVRDASVLSKSKSPDFFFYAKEESSRIGDLHQAEGAFQYGRESITISTLDRIDADPNDVVSFEGEVWIVADVQRVKVHKAEQFSKNPPRKTYMRLRK